MNNTSFRDRIKGLRKVHASDLIPHPMNWRRHPESQREALRGVLSEVGIVDVPICRELPDGRLQLLDGHLRQEVLGDAEISVLVLDIADDAEAAKVLATLDPIAAMAEASTRELDQILRMVDTGSAAVQEMLAELAGAAGMYKSDDGSTEDEPGRLAGQQEEKREIVEDEIPNSPVSPITKPGDLWLLGHHRLLCGDSTKAEDVERLMAGAKADLCFTSPPYAQQRTYDKDSGFLPIPEESYIDWWQLVQQNARASMSETASFLLNIKPHSTNGQRVLYVFDLVLAMVRNWNWRFVDELIWKKTGMPGAWPERFRNDFEPVYHFSVAKTFTLNHYANAVESDNCFEYDPKWGDERKNTGQVGFGNQHPDRKTEKSRPGNVISISTCQPKKDVTLHSAAFPVALASWFIKAFSNEGDKIYEPFCGSGTTMIAAEQLNRRCYGMEISPQYCDVIVARWEKLTGRKATLERR